MLFDFREDNLFSEEEGYSKGNMFKNLYEDYKNYKPSRVNINNKEIELMELDFAINDLKLYLCTHPNDKEVESKLKKYEKMYEMKSNGYREEEYV